MNYLDAGEYFEKEARGNVEAIQLAIDALDLAHSYRWHDLVEDSQDLPHNGTKVLRAIKDVGSRCKYEIGYLAGDEVAWRYIEPFNLANAERIKALNEAYDRGFADGRESTRDGCATCRYSQNDGETFPCNLCRNNHPDKWEKA